jgi:hypothetical protein
MVRENIGGRSYKASFKICLTHKSRPGMKELKFERFKKIGKYDTLCSNVNIIHLFTASGPIIKKIL